MNIVKHHLNTKDQKCYLCRSKYLLQRKNSKNA